MLLISVAKRDAVRITVIKCIRSGTEEKYERLDEWFLKDLVLLDGKDSETVSFVASGQLQQLKKKTT